MVEGGNPKEFVWKNVGHQYYAVAIGNVLNFILGSIQSWITPVIPILMSDNTPLITGPLNNEQMSWLASSGSIGAIIGNFAFSAVTSFWGCKQSTLWLALPSVGFWLFVYFGNTFEYLVIGRLVGGVVSGGLLSTLTIYTSEIANDEIRGKLGSIALLTRNMGQLICFIIGSTIKYHYTPCIFVLIPVISSIIFITLPNTPQYYLRKSQHQEAEKALKYYKGYKGKTLEECHAFSAEFQRLSGVIEQQKTQEKLKFYDLCNRNALKGICIAIVLAVLMVASANFSLLNYAILVFQKSGTDISPTISSVMLFIAQIIGCLCTTGLADKLGRKILLIVSLLGSAIGLSTLALYLYLMENGVDTHLFTWIPVVSLSFAIFIGSAGIIPLASLCTIELLPFKIRSFGLCVGIFVYSAGCFFSTKTFPIWMADFGLPITLLIYAALSFVGAFFVAFAVRETKGQSMDDVE